jgi:hypothetical protein
MKTFNYNKEILIATAQIQMLFNNISIKRNNVNITVPCVFGQRSRILKFLQNPEGSSFKLPMSHLARSGIIYNAARSANIHQHILTQSANSAFDPNRITPVPVDITYNLTIMTKYPDDMDMLLSNFIPFFHKDVYVTSPHPKIPNTTINHQIVWNGTIDDKWPEELQPNENDIQICNTSFTYKTELFGGSGYISPTTEGLIYTIDMTLSPSTSNINDSYVLSGNNVLGGFYPVPYTESFSTYIDKILNVTNISYIDDPIRDDRIFNTFNDKFNIGVLSGELSAVQNAVLSGADIYKTSYWPLTYAIDKNYTDIVSYIESLSGYIHR